MPEGRLPQAALEAAGRPVQTAGPGRRPARPVRLIPACHRASGALPHFGRERALHVRGALFVAGVDEAGRGPLAGPVAAAAVILDPSDLPGAVDDSKALTPAQRDGLFDVIVAKALAVGIGFAPPREIDSVNVRQATFAAMRRAVAALALRPDHVLVDGNALPPRLGIAGDAIVKGDATCLSIAAASIVAKVARDRLMVRLDRVHPRYGLARHKGYPTPAHVAALREHGPCGAHRLSFAPCRTGGAGGNPRR